MLHSFRLCSRTLSQKVKLPSGVSATQGAGKFLACDSRLHFSQQRSGTTSKSRIPLRQASSVSLTQYKAQTPFLKRSSSDSSSSSSSSGINSSTPEPSTPSDPTTTSTMAPIPPIFTLSIPGYKSKTHTSPEGGTITLTQPYPKIYLLTFNSAPDNRLTPPFLTTFRLALDILLSSLPPGVVVTTSAIPKFYSNGLDYTGAIGDPNFMTEQLYPLWRRLLTFPWPTVALVNGHAFAGGLMTAMAHDYRIMNPHKGFLCLNELDFNAPLTPAMSSLFKAKLAMGTFRTMVLEGKRFNALAALEAGIIDGVGALDDAVKMIKELGIDGKVRDVGVGSYGLIKEEMYREVIADLELGLEGEKAWTDKKKVKRDKALKEAEQNVDEWKKNGGKLGDIKAKL